MDFFEWLITDHRYGWGVAPGAVIVATFMLRYASGTEGRDAERAEAAFWAKVDAACRSAGLSAWLDREVDGTLTMFTCHIWCDGASYRVEVHAWKDGIPEVVHSRSFASLQDVVAFVGPDTVFLVTDFSSASTGKLDPPAPRSDV